MVDVRTFVQQCLTEIAEGVIQTQNKLSGSATQINPEGIKGSVEGRYYLDINRHVSVVEFDIAITAIETSGGGGQVKVLGMGLDGQLKDTTTVASRIRFSVPVAFRPDSHVTVGPAIPKS